MKILLTIYYMGLLLTISFPVLLILFTYRSDIIDCFPVLFIFVYSNFDNSVLGPLLAIWMFFGYHIGLFMLWILVRFINKYRKLDNFTLLIPPISWVVLTIISCLYFIFSGKWLSKIGETRILSREILFLIPALLSFTILIYILKKIIFGGKNVIKKT